MRLLLGMIGLALALSACTGPADLKDTVRGYIAATQRHAREFAYVENFAGSTTRVTGVVRDDTQYRANVEVDGRPQYQEVVRDDARAVHFDSVEWLTKLQKPVATATAPNPAASTSSAAQAAITTLESGSWVIDRAGGSSFQAPATNNGPLGADPMLDALHGLDYLRTAIDAASAVQKFNPEATNYDPGTDPFPHPQTGVLRFDLLPTALPPRKQPGVGPGQQQQHGLSMDNFRKIAVYVKDGLVVEFREAIDIRTLLQDPRQDLAGDLSDEGVKIPSGTLDQQVEAIVKGLNAVQSRSGQQPIRMRTMTMTFGRLGIKQPVEPPAAAVEGTLAALVGRGQVLQQPAP